MYSLLIVDDEPMLRAFFRQNLPQMAPDWHLAGEASDGREALALMDTLKPDLVLTDIKMPVMNGLELCRALSERDPDQQVAILSGHDEFEFAREAIRYNVREYLLKPVRRAEVTALLDRVATLLEGARAKNSAFRALEGLSGEYRNHLACSYLAAVIAGRHSEIRMLHPLLYRLRMDVMGMVCVPMIVEPDVAGALEAGIPANELEVFRFILRQAAKEMVQEAQAGFVVSDAMDRIVVCVTGEEEPETLQRCRTLYRGLRQFMSAHAGIGVSGVCGRPVPDVQELGQSFEEALAHLSPLMPDALALAPVQDGTDTPGGRQVVERTIRRIWSVYSDANEPALHEALEAYAGAAGSGASGPVLRYGLYLLTRMCGMMPAARILQKERAVNALVGALAEPQRKQDARSIAGLYARMLQTLDTEAADPEESASDPQHLARRAREYVLDHFAEPISLSLVADHLEVSPGHLGKLFQEQLHESYIKFLTRIRMEQAEHLLRHAETPIQTVAARTGYVNQKHFCHVFKQYHGMTAGEWQRRNVSPGAFPSP